MVIPTDATPFVATKLIPFYIEDVQRVYIEVRCTATSLLTI